MERVRGETLEQRFKEPVDWALFQPIFLDICRAVSALHREGIVHRDLKPSNVMIGSDGTVTLLDFGLAKDLNSMDLTLTGSLILGSPMYLAPEQISGEAIDMRCDIYQLGLILFRMLAGIHAYGDMSSTLEILVKKLKLSTPVWPHHLPPPPEIVKGIFQGCLQRKPSGRFQTMIELIEVVENQQLKRLKRLQFAVHRNRFLLLGFFFFLVFSGLAGIGLKSKSWLRLSHVERKGQIVSVKNGFGKKLWEHEFSNHHVIRASLSTRVNERGIKNRRNIGSQNHVIAYLSPIRDALLDPRQSVNDDKADNRIAWLDYQGHLVTDRSLVDLLSFNTDDFARALYFDQFEEKDRDGDGFNETLIRICHKNSMYPAGFIFEENGYFYAFLSKGHIQHTELISVNDREWRFLVLSSNNPMGHMNQLSEVVFKRGESGPGKFMYNFPDKFENLLQEKDFVMLLPGGGVESPLNWDSPVGIQYSIAGGQRRLSIHRDGELVLSDGQRQDVYKDPADTLHLLFHNLNQFYVHYYTNLNQDQKKGLSALDEAEKISCENPFLRSLILYFRGCTQLDAGEYGAASAGLRAALALFPESNDIVQKLCEIPFLMGDPINALKILDEDYPLHDSFWGLTVLGRNLFKSYCYLQAGHFSKAEGVLSKLFSEGRYSESLPFFIGLIRLYEHGKVDGILRENGKEFGEGVNLLTVQDFRFLLARAMLLGEKDLELCAFYFSDLDRFSQKRGHMAQVSLAWLAARKGEKEAEVRAADGLKEMIRRSKGDFETRFWLFYDAYLYARIMDMSGRDKDAVRGYRLCVESAPHSHLAELSRQRLKN